VYPLHPYLTAISNRLKPAVKWRPLAGICEAARGRCGQGELRFARTEDGTGNHLLRIGQEAFTNAIKYAGEPGGSSMSQSTTIRVLLVDDHAVVRQGLAARIENEPDMIVVGQAGNGQEAIACYRQLQPDITLMGLRISH
jgi:hypothetical protein